MSEQSIYCCQETKKETNTLPVTQGTYFPLQCLELLQIFHIQAQTRQFQVGEPKKERH